VTRPSGRRPRGDGGPRAGGGAAGPARRARRLTAGGLLAAALAAGGLSLPVLAGASGVPSGRRDSPAPVSAPLAGSYAAPSATWADVAMGLLGQPDNTFWQLFVLSSGSTRWSLVTPPGVADNGGLVGAPGPGGELAVGFGASQRLGFSPLATTDDHGRSWTASADPLPSPLRADPDALAVSAGGAALALVRSDGTTVEASGSGLGDWGRVATQAAVAASAGGRRCGVLGLSAVAFAPEAQHAARQAPVLGADCSRAGQLGVLRRAGSGWVLAAGASLPATDPRAEASVLRLGDLQGRLVALVALAPQPGSSRGDRLLAAVQPAGSQQWSWSPALALTRGATITSTGTGANGALVVTYRAGSELVAAAEHAAAGPWSVLRRLPAGTATVTAVPGGGFDALSVNRSTMTSYSLAPGGSRWSETQRIDVPIDYGSSS
jgi:hypothetical protein